MNRFLNVFYVILGTFSYFKNKNRWNKTARLGRSLIPSYETLLIPDGNPNLYEVIERQRFSNNFKGKIVIEMLSEQGRTVQEISEELGIYTHHLDRWKQQFFETSNYNLNRNTNL